MHIGALLPGSRGTCTYPEVAAFEVVLLHAHGDTLLPAVGAGVTAGYHMLCAGRVTDATAQLGFNHDTPSTYDCFHWCSSLSGDCAS